ncbi:MAG: hypothetical protein L3J56_14130, partial [Bacteroidales bacterium]|nr:hypothetical protein [Bacteroidales bacterium]
LLITWVDIKTEDDETKVKEILNLADTFHKQVIRDYAFLHKKLPKNMFGEALKNFKDSIDDFEDSISEVQDVIFVLRKDDELMNMIEQL